MDRISSSTAGTICTLTTPETSKAGSAPASERAKDGGGPATVEAGCFADATATAGSAEIPKPPAGPPDRGWEDKALDWAFGQKRDLEAKLDKLNPESPDYQKEITKITMKLQTMSEIISLVREARKEQHDLIMKTIETI
jgi:hypothetical protein